MGKILNKKFGRLIKNGRGGTALTQWGLVQELRAQRGFEHRYSKSDISKWENGKTVPSQEVIELLSDILGMPLYLLLEAAGYLVPQANKQNKDGLFRDLQELAKVIESQIHTPPAIIVISDDVASKIVSQRQSATTTFRDALQNYNNYPKLQPQQQAIYYRFLEMPESKEFTKRFEVWKNLSRRYYELAELGDQLQLDQLRVEIERMANQAKYELWCAVESMR